MQSTLETVCRTVTGCADLWKDVSKSVGKRRALSELLKLLESFGLSRHKSIFLEVLKNKWYFLFVVFNVHLDLRMNLLFSFNTFSQCLRCYWSILCYTSFMRFFSYD